MTTWKEAFEAFRAERLEAETVKQIRDELIRALELEKIPRVFTTGREHKHYKETSVQPNSKKIRDLAQVNYLRVCY